MKKKLFFLVAIVLLLVGCKQEKFYLEDELYEKATITDISVEEFEKLESEDKSFLLFVYLPGCTSCAAFSEVITEFHENNQVEVYSISINEVKDTTIMKHIKYAPSLFIFNKGKVVDCLDATSDKDKPMLTEVNSFKSWLEEYVYLTK